MGRWDDPTKHYYVIKGKWTKRILFGMVILGVWQLGEFGVIGMLALFESLGR